MQEKEKPAALAGHNSKQVTGISRPRVRSAMRLRRSGDAIGTIIRVSRSVRPPTPRPPSLTQRGPTDGGKSERCFPGKSKEGEGVSKLQADPLPTCYRLLLPLECSAYPSGWLSLNYSSLRRRRACQSVEVAAAWLVFLVRVDRVPPPRHRDYYHPTSALCRAVHD